MPRVDDAYKGDTVRTQPLPTIRQQAPSADVYGAQLGQALEGAGRGLGTLFQGIRDEQKDRIDSLALVTAKRKFNDLYRQEALAEEAVTYADGVKGTKGFFLLQGYDPHALYEGKMGRYDAQADEIVATATNERQRAAFTALAEGESSRYKEQALRHSSTQLTEYEQGEVQATLKSTIDTGGAAAGKEGGQETITDQLDTGERLIRAKAGVLHLESQAEVDRAVAEHRSMIHLAVVNSLLDQGKDIEAKAYWDRVSAPTAAYPQGEILATQSEATRQKLDINSTDGAALRDSEMVFDLDGPKVIGDVVDRVAMQKRARALATDPATGQVDTKRLNRTMEYVGLRVSDWNATDADRINKNKAAVDLMVSKKMPWPQIQASVEFQNLPDGERSQVIRKVEEDIRATHNDARSLLGEQRQDITWFEGRADRAELLPYQKLQRAEQMRAIQGAGTYMALVQNNPELVKMSPEAVDRLAGGMSTEQFVSIKRQYLSARGAADASQAVSVDLQAFNNAMLRANMPVNSTKKKDVENYTAMHVAVEHAMSQLQQARAGVSGVKETLSIADQEKVIQEVFSRQVMVPGSVLWSTPTLAPLVKQDDLGKAYVDLAKIQAEHPNALTKMVAFIKEVQQPIGQGRTTSNLQTEEVLARYQGLIERAYALYVDQVPEEHIKAFIRDGLGVGVPPPAKPTPAPARRPVGMPQPAPAEAPAARSNRPVPPPTSPPVAAPSYRQRTAPPPQGAQ